MAKQYAPKPEAPVETGLVQSGDAETADMLGFSSFVQTSQAPTEFKELSADNRADNSGAGSSIIAMIQKLITDIESDEQEKKRDEAEATKDYQDMTAASASSRKTKQSDIP